MHSFIQDPSIHYIYIFLLNHGAYCVCKRFAKVPSSKNQLAEHSYSSKYNPSIEYIHQLLKTSGQHQGRQFCEKPRPAKEEKCYTSESYILSRISSDSTKSPRSSFRYLEVCTTVTRGRVHRNTSSCYDEGSE